MIDICKIFSSFFKSLRCINPLRSNSKPTGPGCQVAKTNNSSNSSTVATPSDTKFAISHKLINIKPFNGIDNIAAFNSFNSFFHFLRQPFFHNRYILIDRKSTKKFNDNVYNLSIDNDESYITRLGITHNCRCVAVQVRKSKYPVSDSSAAQEKGEKATTQIGKSGINKAAIFRFNPGKEMKLMPPKHPYLPKGCGNCKFRKERNLADLNNPMCQACKILDKCMNRVITKSTVKTYENGGKIEVYNNINKETDDYKRILSAATFFAEQGKQVIITPKFDGSKYCPDYNSIYGSLKDTKYFGKCPDFCVDGVWYEHEGFVTNKPKNAFNKMCNRGLKQSDRIVIEDCGLSKVYMQRVIEGRLKDGQLISEIWLHSDGKLTLLYKKTDG